MPNPTTLARIECRAFTALVLLAGLLAITGCSNLGVKPHQRGLLAKKSMLLTNYPMEAGLDDHIYFSKEASSGGRGFGGGGCGCN
jgi:hypothetical protein